MSPKILIALSTALVLAAASAAPAMAKSAKHRSAVRSAPAKITGFYASAMPFYAEQVLFERAKGNRECERFGAWCASF